MSELKHYRLYTLDRDGRISKAALLEYLSEDEAVSFAREQARGGRSVELWQGSEQIAYIAASDPESLFGNSGMGVPAQEISAHGDEDHGL